MWHCSFSMPCDNHSAARTTLSIRTMYDTVINSILALSEVLAPFQSQQEPITTEQAHLKASEDRQLAHRVRVANNGVTPRAHTPLLSVRKQGKFLPRGRAKNAPTGDMGQYSMGGSKGDSYLFHTKYKHAVTTAGWRQKLWCQDKPSQQ